MARMMKTFVMKRIGEVGFWEKPQPEDPGLAGAIVRTTHALVCTSDTHTVEGAIGERTNLTLGQEAIGVVTKLGREVRNVKEGDRVAVNAITPRFQCENCLRGFTSQCQQMLGGWKFANIRDGVFASHFLRERCRRQPHRDEAGGSDADDDPSLQIRSEFDQIDRAFEMMKTKAEEIIKPLITFD